MSASSDERDDQALRLAAALFGGFALLATVNACAIAVAVPLPSGGTSARVAHHVFDAAETLGVGTLFALAVATFRRVLLVPRWVRGAIAFAAVAGVVSWTAGEYVKRVAWHLLDGRFAWALFVGGIAVPSAAIAAGPWVARRLALRGEDPVAADCTGRGAHDSRPDAAAR